MTDVFCPFPSFRMVACPQRDAVRARHPHPHVCRHAADPSAGAVSMHCDPRERREKKCFVHPLRLSFHSLRDERKHGFTCSQRTTIAGQSSFSGRSACAYVCLNVFHPAALWKSASSFPPAQQNTILVWTIHCGDKRSREHSPLNFYLFNQNLYSPQEFRRVFCRAFFASYLE